jgi:hypothetical protein
LGTRTPLGEKIARVISPNAVIPSGKSVRGGADLNVPPPAERGQETISYSGKAVTSFSQNRSHWPYQKWDLKKYLQEPSTSRKLFWERACHEKKTEMTTFLNELREREEVVQEARQEFGAGAFGLRPGNPVRSESQAAYRASLDDGAEEVL